MSADSASSAPARSIEATAMSTSTVLMTSEIGMRWTSTSNIERSIASGFMPWLIVRLPWGSRSITSTRFPRSRSATPRLSVVVVFATPPFWFASAMTFAISAPSGSGATTGSGTALRRGGSSTASTGSSSTGSGRDWRRGSRRERAMAASPSRQAVKLLLPLSILAFPVVELLADARDQAEPDEEHLPRARVVAEVARIARAVHQERHARVASAERVRDARSRLTADDGAGADGVLRDPVLLPQEYVAVTLEDNEDLLLGGMAVRRRVQLSREHLREADPRLHRAHLFPRVANAAADRRRLALGGVEIRDVDDRRGPRCELAVLDRSGGGLARPGVVLLGTDRSPGLTEPRHTCARKPGDALREGALPEREHVQPVRACVERVRVLEGDVQKAVAGADLVPD